MEVKLTDFTPQELQVLQWAMNRFVCQDERAKEFKEECDLLEVQILNARVIVDERERIASN